MLSDVKNNKFNTEKFKKKILSVVDRGVSLWFNETGDITSICRRPYWSVSGLLR